MLYYNINMDDKDKINFQQYCKRCNKYFISYKIAMTGELPKVCPKCHSPYWNKERIKQL